MASERGTGDETGVETDVARGGDVFPLKHGAGPGGMTQRVRELHGVREDADAGG